MPNRKSIIETLCKSLPYIRQEFDVVSMQLFGSVARGDFKSDSDVDLLVEMPPKIFKLIGLKDYLQNLLGMPVDVVRKHHNLDEFLIREIQRDGIEILA